ncbi:hypothetical protein WDW37_19005 [Bdellovibrionota bacterium FG-1]
MTITYTEKLKNAYEEARRLNSEQCAAGKVNVYHCAVGAGDITPRSLDLKNPYVFCEIKEDKVAPDKKNNDIKEYRLQAYLVRMAMLNKMMMTFPAPRGQFLEFKWELLDAERRFAGVGAHRRFDLLAYDQSSCEYIVLELKPNRNSLSTACGELKSYRDLIGIEINAINTMYGKTVSRDKVKGYVVMPRSKRPNTKLVNEALGKEWGLIEFEGDLEIDLFSEDKMLFNLWK